MPFLGPPPSLSPSCTYYPCPSKLLMIPHSWPPWSIITAQPPLIRANDLLATNLNPLSLPRAHSGATSSEEFLEILISVIIIKKLTPSELLGEGFVPSLGSKKLWPIPVSPGCSMVNEKWKGERLNATAHRKV